MINGDKPIVRVINNKPFVYGTPWMGKEALGQNISVPLSSICFIKRSETNNISKTDFNSTFPRLLGQTYRPTSKALLTKTIELLNQVSKTISIYELSCNMLDEAALVAYKEMKK